MDMIREGGYATNFRHFVIFLIFHRRQNAKKNALAIEYDVFSWKVSPQLSCSDNFQIGILLNPHSRKVVAGWMWTGRLLILLE